VVCVGVPLGAPCFQGFVGVCMHAAFVPASSMYDAAVIHKKRFFGTILSMAHLVSCSM